MIALLLIGGAVWLSLGALADLAQRLRPYGWQLVRQPWRLPATAFSAPLAHAGLAIMIIGVIAASMWQSETVVAAKAGETMEVAGRQLRFDGVREVEGPNYQAEQGQISYLSGPHQGKVLLPERRFYQAERGQTTEAAITSDISGHLYAVIGEAVAEKRVLRLWFHPLVALIWIGALLMALGGGFALRARMSKTGQGAA